MPPIFDRSSNPIAFDEKFGCSFFGNRIFEYQERHLSKIMASCWRLSVATAGETYTEMRERETRGAIFETTKGGHVSSMTYFFAQKRTVPLRSMLPPDDDRPIPQSKISRTRFLEHHRSQLATLPFGLLELEIEFLERMNTLCRREALKMLIGAR